MKLIPADIDDLARLLREASGQRTPVGEIDLSGLEGTVRHAPEDMTAVVGAGISLSDLQSRLGRSGQWLPVDPPAPERLTVGTLIADDLNGPRRYGFGTIREHLIGITVVLVDGRIVKAGGNVVKNVAGYDLCRLFVGSRGTLGIVVEAAFKLRPLPESETILAARYDTLDGALTLLDTIFDARLDPVVLDLHDPGGAGTKGRYTVTVGFAGITEDVAAQAGRAERLAVFEPASLDYDMMRAARSGRKIGTRSVLPSKLGKELRRLGDIPFVARAGNGVLYMDGSIPIPTPGTNKALRDLTERIKTAYDPAGILPRLEGY